MAKLRALDDNITKRLDTMISKGRDGRAFMMRVVLPEYKKAQRKRFMTENESESEGKKWAPLKNKKYADYKLKKFAKFPGGGRKINIATGKLFNALVLNNREDVSVVATSTSLVINIEIEYAKYVNEVRPIMSFKESWTEDLKKRYWKWMLER